MHAFFFAVLVALSVGTGSCQTGTTAEPASSVDQQVRKLSDPDPIVRKNAAEALGRMESRAAAAVKPLVQRLKDPDADVRFYVVWALAYIGSAPELCVPALLASMDDPDPDVSMQSALSLTAFPQYASRIVPKMMAGIRSKDHLRRYYCLMNIGDFGKEARSAIPLIVQGTRDSDISIRIVAAVSLRKIRIYTPEVENALLALLNQNEFLLSDLAAATLGEIGEASPAVRNGLAERFTPVPISADGTQAAISFADLLDRSLSKLVLRPQAERDRLRTQCLSAEDKIRHNMGLFGDASKTTEPALKKLERINSALGAKQ